MAAAVPDLATLLAAAARGGQGLGALPPDRCAAALGLDGLTISLVNRSGLELVWNDPADAVGITFEDVQYTLGEGPTHEAAAVGEAVVVPDLHALPDGRWPALLPAVRGLGIRAVHSLPLRLGAIRLGALTGHHATPVRLGRRQVADALTLAETATLILLTPEGTRDMGSDHPLPLHRALIHQAAGVLTVRFGIPIDQALVRLRAYAFAHDRPILDVAHEIVHRRSSPDNSPK
ncbi:ANTAR domain-containing protein [Streptomyces arenae]|nr:ANTAR domain-containing protein [Streptomyces arenae]